MNRQYIVRKVFLKDVAFFQEGPGLRSFQWAPEGMKVINVTNIMGDGSIDVTNTDKYIAQTEYETNYSHFTVEENDIVVASSGNTYGKVGRIRSEHLPIMMNTSVIRFHSLDKNTLDDDFLYGWLRSPDFKNQVEGFVTGGAQPNFGPSHLKQMSICLPEISSQRRIADVVSAYDDLIENNRRRMALLEESARLLYREWFVRLRFPGHEHTPIIKGIPEGWEKVPTPDAVDVNPKTPLSDDENWFVEMSDLPTDSMVIQTAVKRVGRSGSKFRNGDTLLARITPCLENGKTGFVNFMAGGEAGRGSTEFIVLRSKRVTPEYVYCLARTYAFRENAIKSMVGSSGRQRVQESCFDKFMVLIPPRIILDLFSDATTPIFDQIRVLHAQNQKLKAARDLLLPRLMNGDLLT